MTKYLEQTSWLLNPHPDKRKGGRWAMQAWNVGTRWIFDESRGIVSGERVRVGGQLAETIVANSKEVEPGFGALVSDWDLTKIIGNLVDQGKLSVEEIRDILRIDEYQDEDDESEDDDDSETYQTDALRLQLDQHLFRYRHWLTLDPPREALVRKVEEDERRNAILDEYAKRIEKPK